jgi:hypothetical protein
MEVKQLEMANNIQLLNWYGSIHAGMPVNEIAKSLSEMQIL